MKIFNSLWYKICNSRFFKDSFWAVFGNGLGNVLLLLAGILIARLLGKDVYGEYGFVKTTMFHLAAFSTLGLGYTSTKFIAEYRAKNPRVLKSIIIASRIITLVTSTILALFLFIFSKSLAGYLNEPSLEMPFRVLGVIVIFRALSTTYGGLLAGFGDFQTLAKNNVISGIIMLLLCIPLTYYWSLKGSLAALVVSQIVLFVSNARSTNIIKTKLEDQEEGSFIVPIFKFSIPIAMQEFTFAICNWLAILMITKLSTIGEVGIYTASSQWSSIILFIPTILYNVMLSHLSYAIGDQDLQKKNVNMMLMVNLVCTLIPFIIIYFLAPWITTFYGQSFTAMVPVLRLLVLSTIFTCCSNVLSTELIAQGCNWSLFSIRCTRDILTLAIGYLCIISFDRDTAAYSFSLAYLLCAAIFFILLFIYYRVIILVKNGHQPSVSKTS